MAEPHGSKQPPTDQEARELGSRASTRNARVPKNRSQTP